MKNLLSNKNFKESNEGVLSLEEYDNSTISTYLDFVYLDDKAFDSDIELIQ